MTSHRGHQPPSSSHITARREMRKIRKTDDYYRWLLRETGDSSERRVIVDTDGWFVWVHKYCIIWETFNTIKKPRATCPLYVRTRCPAPATPAPGPGGPWPLGWATRAAASLLSIFDISLPSIVTAAPPHQGTSQGGPRTCKQSLYFVYVPINCRPRCLKWKSV